MSVRAYLKEKLIQFCGGDFVDRFFKLIFVEFLAIVGLWFLIQEQRVVTIIGICVLGVTCCSASLIWISNYIHEDYKKWKKKANK